MPRKDKLVISVIVIATLVGLAWTWFTWKSISPPTTPPNPNGYDDFVKAGGNVAGDLSDFPVMERDSLRELISTNAENLALARLGLTRKCLAPTEAFITNAAALMDSLPNLKRLAQLFGAEARLAELEDRPDVAASSCLDAIRIGNESSRGGLIINRLVGIACEAFGMSQLVKLVPKLNCDQSRLSLSQLVTINDETVSWAEILQNESRFARYQSRRSANPLHPIINYWLTRPMIAKAEAKHRRAAAHMRLIMGEIALRCFKSEHGRPPSTLGELVPKYLSIVPGDPFSSGPLLYRPRGTNWLLYSIGTDKVDDGGKPVGKSSGGIPGKGDIFFDSPW